jgi:hypothetical protein
MPKNRDDGRRVRDPNPNDDMEDGMLDVELLEDYDVREEQTHERVAKELFTATTRSVRFKTDLTQEEINALSKVEYFHKMFPRLSDLQTLGQTFMELKISKDRQSRREFVDTLRGQMEREKGDDGFMNSLMRRFGGDRGAI